MHLTLNAEYDLYRWGPDHPRAVAARRRRRVPPHDRGPVGPRRPRRGAPGVPGPGGAGHPLGLRRQPPRLPPGHPGAAARVLRRLPGAGGRVRAAAPPRPGVDRARRSGFPFRALAADEGVLFARPLHPRCARRPVAGPSSGPWPSCARASPRCTSGRRSTPPSCGPWPPTGRAGSTTTTWSPATRRWRPWPRRAGVPFVGYRELATSSGADAQPHVLVTTPSQAHGADGAPVAARLITTPPAGSSVMARARDVAATARNADGLGVEPRSPSEIVGVADHAPQLVGAVRADGGQVAADQVAGAVGAGRTASATRPPSADRSSTRAVGGIGLGRRRWPGSGRFPAPPAPCSSMRRSWSTTFNRQHAATTATDGRCHAPPRPPAAVPRRRGRSGATIGRQVELRWGFRRAIRRCGPRRLGRRRADAGARKAATSRCSATSARHRGHSSRWRSTASRSSASTASRA